VATRDKPLTWAGFAAVLSLTRRRGRRAVVRGVACSAAASVIHLPIKRLLRRPRPRGARLIGGPGPLTSSFPSGHTASDLAFLFGASQELPLRLIPGSVATVCSYWSLIRTRKHYPSDVIGDGAIAVVVAATAWKLQPPKRQLDPQTQSSAETCGPARWHRVKRPAMRLVTNQLLNRLTRPLLECGVWPRTQALIETTGRTSGLPRRVPVGNGGLGDNEFCSSPSMATVLTTSGTSSTIRRCASRSAAPGMTESLTSCPYGARCPPTYAQRPGRPNGFRPSSGTFYGSAVR
jgi:membrane-associated phospholipid phosphatase